MNCDTCIDRNIPTDVNYGELNAIGGEIKVRSCYAEYYDEKEDKCYCANYDPDISEISIGEIK
ncbi:hypothetical protein KAR91_26445 [Candidatus Pacearchaeota archaeon]|nr:hypothetical protein [Candidatus Pacearchaeota archaeon]